MRTIKGCNKIRQRPYSYMKVQYAAKPTPVINFNSTAAEPFSSLLLPNQ